MSFFEFRDMGKYLYSTWVVLSGTRGCMSESRVSVCAHAQGRTVLYLRVFVRFSLCMFVPLCVVRGLLSLSILNSYE